MCVGQRCDHRSADFGDQESEQDWEERAVEVDHALRTRESVELWWPNLREIYSCEHALDMQLEAETLNTED